MQAKTVRRIVIALFVSAIAGTATVGAVRHSSLSAGVATGESVNGVPVYRLPTVNVTVSRSAALAEMAKEDALASK